MKRRIRDTHSTECSRRAPIIWAVALAGCLCALPAQDDPLFRADVSLVTVPVVVTDQRGLTVKDLTAADFRVYADGVVQQVRNLWTETDLPLQLGIIVDISESQKDQKAEHESAVTQFLERFIRPRDHAFVVAVNENVMLKSEVTGGQRGLRYRVLSTLAGEPLGVPCGSLHGDHGRTRPICGGTALWNAVYASPT